MLNFTFSMTDYKNAMGHYTPVNEALTADAYRKFHMRYINGNWSGEMVHYPEKTYKLVINSR